MILALSPDVVDGIVWVPLWGSCGAFYETIRPVHHYASFLSGKKPTYIVKLPESKVDLTILVITKRQPTCQWKGYCVVVCA